MPIVITMVVLFLLKRRCWNMKTRIIAAMNAVVFGLLGFVLLYLDRKLPVYARGHLVLRCIVFTGSVIFLDVAFLKLL